MKQQTHPDNLVEHYGKTVAAYRLGLNITQSALAARAGVSPSTVHRIEAGRSVASDSLFRVLVALNLGDHIFHAIPEWRPGPVDRARGFVTGRQRARNGDTSLPPRHHPAVSRRSRKSSGASNSF